MASERRGKTRRVSSTLDQASIRRRSGGPREQSQSHCRAYTFLGHFEDKAAPKTVAAVVKRMLFVGKIIHVRWSGEGGRVPSAT